MRKSRAGKLKIILWIWIFSLFSALDFLVRKIKEQEIKKILLFFTLFFYIPWNAPIPSKFQFLIIKLIVIQYLFLFKMYLNLFKVLNRVSWRSLCWTCKWSAANRTLVTNSEPLSSTFSIRARLASHWASTEN